MAESSSWQPIEHFDKTWPWSFKWGYDAINDRAHGWRINPEEGDGSVSHRQEYEQHFGRPAQIRGGDQLGIASYIPEERRFDGKLVAPSELQIHTYYNDDPHRNVLGWFEHLFPETIVRRAALTGHFEKAASIPPLRWSWSQQSGPILGEKRFGPQNSTGHAEIRPDHIQIVADGVAPPQGLAAIKSELAKQFPNTEILLPSSPEEIFAGRPSLLERNQRAERVAAWLDENLAVEDEPVVASPSFEPDFIIGGKPYVGKSIFSKLFKRKTAEADMEGAMVAVFIPKEIGKKLVVKGGESVENLHITLAYFVEKAADRDDWEKVAEIVETIAAKTQALKGKVGGVGLFQNDDGDVLWASPSIPGLAELRHEIVEAVEDAGFKVSEEHGFSPHITLKYEHKGKLPKVPNLELDISELSFARGETQQHFKLDGEFVKETSWEMTEWGWPGTYRFITNGKETILEPEQEGEWRAANLDNLQNQFRSYYPDETQSSASGWVVPTKDGQGYGIWAPTIGYGGNEQLGLHELVSTLDRELKKPTHLVEDWGELIDPDLYTSTQPE